MFTSVQIGVDFLVKLDLLNPIITFKKWPINIYKSKVWLG